MQPPLTKNIYSFGLPRSAPCEIEAKVTLDYSTSLVSHDHRQGYAQSDCPFSGTIKDTGIAVPAFLRVGDYRGLAFF